MIELEGVSRSGGADDEDARIDLTVRHASTVALVGPTGCGKSLVAAIAAARARSRVGSVRVLGKEVRRLGASALAKLRRNVGYAPQDPMFFDDESVLGNVGLPLALDGESSAEVRRSAEAALDAVGLREAAGARLRELSGGSRRRAAIARAIAGSPPVVVVDDPIAGLDIDAATQMLSVLDGVREGGAAVLVASAEPRLFSAARYLDWGIYVLDDAPRSLAARPRTQTDPGDEEPQNILPFPAPRAAGGAE